METLIPTTELMMNAIAGGEGVDHIYFLTIKTSYKAASDVAREVARHVNQTPASVYVRWTAELSGPEITVIAAVRIPAVENEVTAFENLEFLLTRIRAMGGVAGVTAHQVVGGRHYEGDVNPQPTPLNGWP